VCVVWVLQRLWMKPRLNTVKMGNCHRLWNKIEWWKSSVLMWEEVKTTEKCEKKVRKEVDEDPDNLSHNARRYGEFSLLWRLIVLSSVVWLMNHTF
jgi:hypothetical protein